MKNIINLSIIILSLITAIKCSAQHVADPDSDKFAGIWKWGNDINGLTLIMKKENNMNLLGGNNPQRLDGIVGFQKLIKNGLVIDDYLAFSTTNAIDRKYSFFGLTGIHDAEPNILRTWGRHKGKSIEMKIQYIDFSHIKILEVTNQEGVRFIQPGQGPTDWSIDIPNNIILTKQ